MLFFIFGEFIIRVLAPITTLPKPFRWTGQLKIYARPNYPCSNAAKLPCQSIRIHMCVIYAGAETRTVS